MRRKGTRTASDLLRIWGLTYASGSLKDVIRKDRTGETEELDEETLAADYVARTAGYFNALPVLRHVYVRFHNPESFEPCLPGESLCEACRRQEWPSAAGLARHQVGPWVHDRFLQTLIDKTTREPFVYWEEAEETFSALRAKVA